MKIQVSQTLHDKLRRLEVKLIQWSIIRSFYFKKTWQLLPYWFITGHLTVKPRNPQRIDKITMGGATVYVQR